MKKITTLFILFLVATVSFSQDNKKVTNLKTFIDFLATTDSIKDYIKVKKQIQQEGLEIKTSTTLSDKEKARLKALYDIAYKQSDTLFNKIVDSVLDDHARQSIKNDPDKFAKSLQSDLNKILSSAKDFSSAYARTKESASRSPIIGIIIQQIIIPFAEEFFREVIVPAVKNEIRTLATNKLKPVVVITPWEKLAPKKK